MRFSKRIGRNVLIFQKVEYMLKFLLANSSLEGKASELESKMKQQSEAIHRQSMGLLVGGIIENTFALTESSSIEPAEPDEPYISFRFRVETNALYVENRSWSWHPLLLIGMSLFMTFYRGSII